MAEKVQLNLFTWMYFNFVITDRGGWVRLKLSLPYFFEKTAAID